MKSGKSPAKVSKNTNAVSVTDIVRTSLAPKVSDPEIAKTLPKTLFPERLTFTIHGVSNAVSNAIRRTILNELLVRCMNVQYHDIVTNDGFIIPEMVSRRLRMVPLAQKTPLDTVFSLSASNPTPVVRDVKSSEIKITHGKLKQLPFNETYTLFTLQPGKSIKISNIGIHQAFSYVQEDSMHVVASAVVSIPLDQKPINMYEPNEGGIRSSVSNPRVWQIGFNTNGTMPAQEIVSYACDNLIERVVAVRTHLQKLEKSNDYYVLVIDGESDTIGNLFMRTILDLFPEIDAIIPSSASIGRVLTIRIRTTDDVNDIFETAIKYITGVLTEIRGYFI